MISIKRNGISLYLISAAALAIGVIIVISHKKSDNKGQVETEVRPTLGDIAVSITTTGVVEPQNRLEIKPGINGRIEKILVREGDRVEVGQVLAWMSSTERAAILDVARAQGEDALKYWEDTYKASPIIAPIDGEVIVREVEPGQTVTTSDVLIVLSDRLIVTAQVDETDIGGIEVGQAAMVSLDAYPETEVKATVDHIARESDVVNNVTIYEVDVLPESVPPVFRSGMSANVEIIEQSKENVLVLPCDAVIHEKGESFVLVRDEAGGELQRRRVELGAQNIDEVEIASGLDENDIALMVSEKYVPAKDSESGRNPFLPSPRKDSKKR